MSKARKYGAFAGVFTPSILTILGVIMYMRLGWVVGQAGLIGALGIIFVAHIISFSTGLSIASIATDKKIKIGGIYYMLSRSLGLPMGGAIGIALFIGTAFSISLYIIGFVESFLSVEVIRNFFHLGQSIQDYRIAGTVVIVTLVVIAFISTSLAIKTQFIILALIALSLVSIFVGFFINPVFVPEKVEMFPAMGNVKLQYVFGIFFPAATGFTAGVAMSGDLEDPKRNIPVGTLAAISVGLIVYIALAIGLAYRVDQRTLINDPEFLYKIVWSLHLLLLGVWGATLSSALGGILGGPRILQALSKDKITWSFLGKGYGKDNEPRIALITTFVLAELGILHGELNAIARIVTMFYLLSYGFINIAYSLENWASTDFRPSFKIPRFIGVIGASACLLVMLFLDLIPMLIALTIMLLIYWFLKRRELKLDFGDVWQSVWTSIIRLGLHRMNQKEIEERNWQPNIILFSGGTAKRPHLIEFGRFLVGKHGMLSNFDLIENQDEKLLFAKHEQSVADESESNKGFFLRRHSCNDIYQGMETIAKIYGFSGVEPNTVLMGWARGSRKPDRFVNMLKTLTDLDLNILLMDYDKNQGFGNKKLIDIWIKGRGNHPNLAVTLSKFILNTNHWRDANVRLIIVNMQNQESESLYRIAEKMLDMMRIQAEIRVLNNQIEKKPFYDLIRKESSMADIIFLGIPDIHSGDEQSFVEETSKLMQDIGTVVLLRASSHFQELDFGAQPRFIRKNSKINNQIELVIKENEIRAPISLPKNMQLAELIKSLINDFTNINTSYHEQYIVNILKHYNDLLHSFEDLINRSFDIIEENDSKTEEEEIKLWINKAQNHFLIRSRKIITEVQKDILEYQKEKLGDGIAFAIKAMDFQLENVEKFITVEYGLEDLQPHKNDDLSLRSFKFNQRLKVRTNKKPVNYQINIKKLIESHLPLSSYQGFYNVLSKWGLFHLQFVVEVQKMMKDMKHIFHVLEKQLEDKKFSQSFVQEKRKEANQLFSNLYAYSEESQKALYAFAVNQSIRIIDKINSDVSQVNANQIIKRPSKYKAKVRDLKASLQEIPELWAKNQNLLYNAAFIELMLSSFEVKLKKIIVETTEKIASNIDKTILQNLHDFSNYIAAYQNEVKKKPNAIFNPESLHLDFNRNSYDMIFKEIMNLTYKDIKLLISKFPEKVDILSDKTFSNFHDTQFGYTEKVQISASRLLDYLVQTEIIDPLQKIIEELPEKLFEIYSVIKDVTRLITFSTYQGDTSGNFELLDSAENILPFLAEQKEKIAQQINKASNYKNNIRQELYSRLNKTIDKFSLYSFEKIAVNLKQYIQKHETKKRISLISENLKKLRSYFNTKIGKLHYHQNEALLLAMKLNAQQLQSNTRVNDILNIVDQVRIKETLHDKLPFYYQQLFLRKHNYYSEFWFGRDKENAEAKKAMRRYKEGYHGGILITGTPNSGKTFLAQNICLKNYPDSNLFILNPPFESSTNPQVFKQYLQKVTGIYGNYAEIFNKIPSKSAIIIDDLELWWEKNENGFELVSTIMNLIDSYSSKCLFIVTVNSYSLALINRIKKIENHFLSIIECGPFSAQELQQIILFRHQSSGLKLKIDKREEENMRTQDYANLFSKYSIQSGGNIGVALQAWISNVVDFMDNTVISKTPKNIDFSALEHLETDIYILLIHFLLHKRMNIEKIARTTHMEHDELLQKISYMKRAGLIVEESSGVFEINTFLNIHIQQILVEKEML